MYNFVKITYLSKYLFVTHTLLFISNEQVPKYCWYFIFVENKLLCLKEIEKNV